jgi:hypothetical protein
VVFFGVPRTVPVSLVLSISVLECGVILRLKLALTAYLQADKVDQTLRDTGSLPSVSCIVLGTLRTTMI